MDKEEQTDLGRDLIEDRPPPLGVVLEVARLAAVRSYGVLGRADLPELDGIAEAAARSMGREAGAVALVDSHHLWYAGAYEVQVRQAKRADSFCEHTLLQTAPLIVRDALADLRFQDHPDVAGEGGVRFYAGVSVLDVDQYRVGTVCVFDRTPGDPELDGVNELLRLAEMTAASLAVRRDALAKGANDPSDRGDLIQGWLGIRIRSLRLHRKDRRPGVLILSVASGSPAARAGIRPTDVLLSIDDQPMWHSPDVAGALANRRPHSLARLQVLRGGQVRERVVNILPEPRGWRPE